MKVLVGDSWIVFVCGLLILVSRCSSVDLLVLFVFMSFMMLLGVIVRFSELNRVWWLYLLVSLWVMSVVVIF